MDYLQELGYLALGSRMKRLAERFAQETAQVYTSESIEFEPRWFPVFRFVADKGKASITAVAEAVGITHPAVNQMAQELVSAGLIKATGDPQDKRRRLLSLSEKGKRLCDQMRPVWRTLHASVSDSVADCGMDLVNAITVMEKALDRRSLTSRFHKLNTGAQQSKIQIKDLSPDLERHFARLNRAWLERYFSLEKHDYDQFAHPDKIVDNGGAVIFACIGEVVVGTCALKKMDDKIYELVKLAVDEAYKGRGIGRMLVEECIKRARKLRAHKIILETNSNLVAAISLYKNLGFTAVAPEKFPYGSGLDRVDLLMEIDLESRTKTKVR